MTIQSDISISIATPLAQAFEASRLTKGQLASMTGVHPTSVLAILKGDPSQQLQNVIRVAAALGKEIVLVPESKIEAALTTQNTDGPMVTIDRDSADLRLGHIAHGFQTRCEQEGITAQEARSALSGTYMALDRMFEGELTVKTPVRFAMVQRAASLFNLTLAAVGRESIYVNINAAIMEHGVSTHLFESAVRDRVEAAKAAEPKRRGRPAQSTKDASVLSIDFPVVAERPGKSAPAHAKTQPLSSGSSMQATMSRRLVRLRGRLVDDTIAAPGNTPPTAVVSVKRQAPRIAEGLEGFYGQLEPFAVRLHDRKDAFALSALCSSRVNSTISKVFGPIWKDGLGLDMSVQIAANQEMRSRITSMAELSFFLQALTETANIRMLADAIKVPTKSLSRMISEPADQAIEPLFRLMQRFGVEVSVSRKDFTIAPETVKMVAGRSI
jgi:plasmid maintenance system antidote protein VapI